MDRPGHRKHLPTEFGRHAGGDQGTAAQRSLDDQHAVGERCDQAIAAWEMFGFGAAPTGCSDTSAPCLAIALANGR